MQNFTYMNFSVGYHVIFELMKVGFKHSVIGFQKKVSMTKINIGSKDVEFNIDESFSWVSCVIQTYEDGLQAFFDCVSAQSVNDKNQHWLKRCRI
jgi:hypothetical protein